jgi:hypothetical protein
MGSWVRTITTPFRKMLNPQRDGKKTPRHHHHSHHHHHKSPSGKNTSLILVFMHDFIHPSI